jgi:hypothetical protein
VRRGAPLILFAAALALAWGQGPARAGTAGADSSVAAAQTAAIDSVGAASVDDFWRTLDPPWYEPLTVRDLDFGLDDAGLDSLVGEGDHVIARMIAGRPWQLGVKPLERFRFNRVEGLVLGGEVRLARAGVRQASLTSGLDYGFAWRRCTHSHKLDVPLLTAKPRDAEGFLVREPWVKLAFEAEGGRTIERFGGDRRPLNDMSALIAGDDPSQYYEMEAWRVGGRYAPHPAVVFRVGVGAGSHRGLGTRTSWSLIGDRNEEQFNEAVLELDRRSLLFSTAIKYNDINFTADWRINQITQVPYDDLAISSKSSYWISQRIFSALWHIQDSQDNSWIIQAELADVTSEIVQEWWSYLGGNGSLRDLDAGLMRGVKSAWFSIEIHEHWNCAKWTNIPLLDNIRPIILMNAGCVESNLCDVHANSRTTYSNLIAVGFVNTVNIVTQQQVQFLFGFNGHSPLSYNNIIIKLIVESS